MSARLSDEAAAQAADAKQAAYFRWCLADERQQVARHVAKQRAEMTERVDDDRHGTQRLQSTIRSLEAELRFLDEMIAKLDRRFAALWDERR